MSKYKFTTMNGKSESLPFIKLDEKPSDKKIIFREGVNRLDKLSNTYYGNPLFGWLILLANPQYGGLEFNIPDDVIIRIPYPFETTMNEYNTKLKEYKDK